MDDFMTPRARLAVYENTNGFPMSNGKTLHMEVKLKQCTIAATMI
jgi:hypothetical protein